MVAGQHMSATDESTRAGLPQGNETLSCAYMRAVCTRPTLGLLTSVEPYELRYRPMPPDPQHGQTLLMILQVVIRSEPSPPK